MLAIRGVVENGAMAASRKLFVLRHAKSSWDDPGLVDHDRPLAPRGRRAVELLAGYLEAEEIRPDLVLCSSARRTLETYEGVHPAGELWVEPELYGASDDGLLARLQQVPNDIGSVMIIGHNPAVQMLVLKLAEMTAGSADLSEVQIKFPTGALATLAFSCAWSELRPDATRLVSVIRPRDLK
jgi:phosphohistidine phosphatase